MRRHLIAALAVSALLAATLATTLALPKSSPGCPRHAPKDGAPCKPKHAECHWQCEGEDHSHRACSCEKDDHGTWRWQCASIGPPCTL